MELLQFINKKTKDKYINFKLISVLYNEKTNTSTFKFSHLEDVSEEQRKEVSQVISEYLENDSKVVVKFSKAFMDEEICSIFIKKYIKDNYPNVISSLENKNINIEQQGNDIAASLWFPRIFYNFLQSKNFVREIEKAFSTRYFENLHVHIYIIDEQSLADDLEEWRQQIDMQTQIEEDNIPRYKVAAIEKFVGETINNYVLPIKSIEKTMLGTIIAGRIKNFQIKSFVRKNKKNEEVEREYFSFILEDETSSIDCVFFPNKSNVAKMRTLTDGQEVVLHGDAEVYNSRYSFKIKNISLCELLPIPQTVVYKGANPEYINIRPQPYISLQQANLFDLAEAVPQYLLDNDLLVFDLETTGLNPIEDEIVEVGAVKISQGKIVETFETLVKPLQIIPEEVIRVHGITNAMVKDAPGIEKVIPDFYKFAENCVLIAYNIDFDFRFLNHQSTKLGYKFSNKQIDALIVARTGLPGLKNYKLKTVAEALNVSLENAHRAVHDAIATAEVVIKLGNKLS